MLFHFFCLKPGKWVIGEKPRKFTVMCDCGNCAGKSIKVQFVPLLLEHTVNLK